MKSFIAIFLTLMFTSEAYSKGQDVQKLPPENLLIAVPGLPILGESRLTWAIKRGDLIWLNGQVIDLGQLDWPQWDKTQVPMVLLPPKKTKARIHIFDEGGSSLGVEALNKVFSPNEFQEKSKVKPAFYQLEISSVDDRILMLSPKFPWIERKKVFECKAPLTEKGLIQKKSLKLCLDSLTALATEKSGRQWFFELQWPRIKDRTENMELLQSDRTLRKQANQSGHIFISERSGGNSFKALAGVTQSEKAVLFESGSRWKDFEVAVLPPSREVVQTQAYSEQVDGYTLAIHSFAADFIDSRALQSPKDFSSRIDLQFVPSNDDQFAVERTEFRQSSTGVSYLLRNWRLEGSGAYNFISSQRGESNSFFSAPNVLGEYASSLGKMTFGGEIETGLLKSGESIAIQEMQFYARKQFDFFPDAEFILGYHRYALIGENPGSSRLGRMTAAVVGLHKDFVLEKGFISADLKLLVSDQIGWDHHILYGRHIASPVDLQMYWGASVGLSRYASQVTTLALGTEIFSEDRLQIGVHFGFVGPGVFGN